MRVADDLARGGSRHMRVDFGQPRVMHSHDDEISVLVPGSGKNGRCRKVELNAELNFATTRDILRN